MNPFSTADRRTDHERVAAAFRAVRKLRLEGRPKLVARMNFMCCGSCAGAALAEKHGEGAHGIFYSTQAEDAFKPQDRWSRRNVSDGNLHRSLYISWTLSPVELIAVCHAFRDEGLVVVVPEGESRSIEIQSGAALRETARLAEKALDDSALGAAL
jgi:hypothetical protein